MDATKMQLKQKINKIYNFTLKLPILVKITVVAFVLVLVFWLVVFLQEKPVVFSYDNNTCVQQLTLFPATSKISGNDFGFSIRNESVFKIGDFQILSLKTCFVANKAPVEGDIKLSVAPFGGWFAKKTFKISVPTPPLARVDMLIQPISTVRPLAIKLSSTDSVFNYKLYANNKSVLCPVKDVEISCDVTSLNLVNENEYTVKLVRMFANKEVETLATKSIKTMSATRVVSTSISIGQIVYDSPKTFSFTFDKDIKKAEIKLEKVNGQTREVVSTKIAIDKKLATVTLDGELSRDTSYEFTIDHLESVNGSSLIEPYKLEFYVSGGPWVTSVSVGTYNQPLSQTIVITLDQTLENANNIVNYISTSGIPTSVSAIGNIIYVNYSNATICTDLNISISPGLRSNYGIAQNRSWSFSTRTTCRTTSVIGYSKQGRSIVAYTFGGGSQSILYVGAIHGNEYSTKYLMDAWVNELEANARSIPADKKIVVVPLLNPDGYALSSRYNASNVDLNRNFSTADWQTDIYSPSNQLIPGGGGATTFSEPESQAIATLSTQLMPRLTMTFHASAGYVIANQAGDSAALAASYANLTGYRNMTGDGGAFTYPITGTYDDWLREKQGLTSVLVELSTSFSSEFYRNKQALWTMARA